MRRAGLVFVFLAAAALVTPGATQAGLGGLTGKLKKAKKARDTASEVNVKIDDEQERFLGRAVSANLIGRYGVVDDPALTGYIATLGTYLGSLSTNPEIAYRFTILDTDEVNAFAAPAGFIFITRGSLAAAGDEAELASILAHEVVHAAERHAVKSIEDAYRKKVIMSGLVEAGAKAVGADPKLVEAFGDLTDDLTESLLTKGYDRKLELQADRGALILLDAARYDPQGLVSFLGRLDDVKGSGSMATLDRTHPSPGKRVKEAKKAIKKEKLAANPDARFAGLFAEAAKR